jgi:DNA-binding transcriptional ArsR family regulator
MNVHSDVATIAAGEEVAVKTPEDCDVRTVDAARVAAVQGRLPSSAALTELADGVFGMLADPSRLRLLVALLEGGELCVCDLAAATRASESATSHSLRLLRAHRVVKVRRSGRMAYYSLLDGHVRLLLDVALEHVSHADD